MKFYGHKALDKHLYDTYFKDFKNGTAVECGAYNGISLSSTYVLELHNSWHCINIEPNPKTYAHLVLNRPKSINLNYGLSDEDGKILMEEGRKDKNAHLTGKQGIMDYLKMPCQRNEGQRNGTIKYEVNVITYKAFIKRYNVKKIDLFVLDVEGWEINVINGMKDAEVLPDVLCVESCPTPNKIINYENHINKIFKGLYKKDSTCWLNDIYVRK